VVVGDFRQLPPIVIADETKNPLAKKWLGTDIFELPGTRPARSTPGGLAQASPRVKHRRGLC